MKALPQAIATGIIHKRHHGREVERRDPGQTPTGWRTESRSTPAPTWWLNSPFISCGRPQANSTTSMPARERAPGVLQRLAVLGGDQAGQPVHVALEQLLEPEHHPHAPQQRRRRPVRLGQERRLHGGVDLRGPAQRHPPGLLAQGRVEHRRMLAAATRIMPPGDEMPDILHVACLPGSSGLARPAGTVTPGSCSRSRTCRATGPATATTRSSSARISAWRASSKRRQRPSAPSIRAATWGLRPVELQHLVGQQPVAGTVAAVEAQQVRHREHAQHRPHPVRVGPGEGRVRQQALDPLDRGLVLDHRLQREPLVDDQRLVLPALDRSRPAPPRGRACRSPRAARSAARLSVMLSARAYCARASSRPSASPA